MRQHHHRGDAHASGHEQQVSRVGIDGVLVAEGAEDLEFVTDLPISEPTTPPPVWPHKELDMP